MKNLRRRRGPPDLGYRHLVDAIEKYVTSRDGTRIGYLEQGNGPGVVLTQGAMADASLYAELAAALSPAMTVFSADRRGRGLSPKPYDAAHDIARDVEDIDAILAATDAHLLFGLSSGAVISLEAARTLDRVTKAAVYEPPFYDNGISRRGIQRLNADIQRGDLGAALFESLRTSGTAPGPIRSIPRAIGKLIGRVVLKIDARSPTDRPKLVDLVPGVRYDFNVVSGVDGRMDTFRAVEKPVLLMSGTRSPAFLRQSVRTLQGILPHARLVEFEGLGHDGPWNRSRGGQPEIVAAELKKFFQ